MDSRCAGRIPRVGERVAIRGETGLFEIVAVDQKAMAVDARLVGPAEYVLRRVPWGVFEFLDPSP